MFDKRQSYLNERIYKKHEGGVRTPELWKELFGDASCQMIESRYPQVRAYFAQEPYTVEEGWPDACDGKIFTLYQHGFYHGKAQWNKEVFDSFYIPWLSTAREYFRYIYPDSRQDTAFFTEGLPGFRKKMVTLSLRVLIQEMKVWGDDGESGELYQRYNEDALKDEIYVDQLYEKYPVMLRELIRCVRQTCESIKECLEYLEKDRGEICQRLLEGRSFGKVTVVKDALGDTHHNGRSVLELTLDTGDKLIYKPHNLEHEAFYQEMTHILSEGCRVETYVRPIVCREDHGWEKQIEASSCGTRENVQDYYYRMGIHLFSAWLFSVKDLHYENIIAMGAYPVFVDTEALLVPERKGDPELLFEVERWKNQSVLATCLLPSRTPGFGRDISGICGSGGKSCLKTPTVLDPGTGKMRMGYAMGDMAEGKNIPRTPKGYEVPENFADEIEKGFTDAFQYALFIKSRLMKAVEDRKDIKGRYLYRYTQEYTLNLWSSYNPLFLSDGGMRHMFLMNMAENKESQTIRRINDLEIEQMLGGDIPYFTADSLDTGLHDPKGEMVEGWFAETPKAMAARRICRLSEQDMGNERTAIREAFDRNFSLNDMVCTAETDRETVVRWILEKIDGEKILLHDGSVAWVQKDYSAEGQGARTTDILSMNLYDGIGGIALFIAAGWKVLKDDRLRQMMDVLRQTLFAYTDQMMQLERKSKTGAFGGEASIVYTYHLLYKITGEKIYLTYSQRHVKILERYIEMDDWYDVVDGNAGAILVLLNLYEETEKGRYLRDAIKAGICLLEHHVEQQQGIAWKNKASGQMLAGFSHGDSGMFLALSRLYHHTGDEGVLDVLKQIREHEMSLYVEEVDDWLDLRGKTPEVRETVAWCHGAGGILLSRLKSYPYLTGTLKEEVAKDIHRAAQKAAIGHIRKDFCLCHGNFGNRWIRDAYRLFSGETGTEKPVSDLLIEKIREHGLEAEESRRYSLMHGLTGIGYGLLREMDPSLPDILAVEV